MQTWAEPWDKCLERETNFLSIPPPLEDVRQHMERSIRAFGIDLNGGSSPVELEGRNLTEILGNLGKLVEAKRKSISNPFGGKEAEDIINSEFAESVINHNVLAWIRFSMGIDKAQKEGIQATFDISKVDTDALRAKAEKYGEEVRRMEAELAADTEAIVQKWQPQIEAEGCKLMAKLCYQTIDKSAELGRIKPELAERFRKSVGFLEERHLTCPGRMGHFEDMLARIKNAESVKLEKEIAFIETMSKDDPDYEEYAGFRDAYLTMGTEKDMFYNDHAPEKDEDTEESASEE